MATSFEKLKVFDLAVDLMVEVYQITERFPPHERYGLVSQSRRAAVSVVSHLAEGQGRLTFGEWRQMLSQGRGSLFELVAQLIAAKRLAYLNDVQYDTLRARADEVGSLLMGLIKFVRRKEAQARLMRSGPRNSQLTTHNRRS